MRSWRKEKKLKSPRSPRFVDACVKQEIMSDEFIQAAEMLGKVKKMSQQR